MGMVGDSIVSKKKKEGKAVFTFDNEPRDFVKDVTLLFNKPGIRVFKILDKVSSERITNNYSFASDKYVQSKSQFARSKTEYELIKIQILIKFWDSKTIYDVITETEISQSVWYQIIRLNDTIKRFGYTPGDYVIYWKRGYGTVWFAFITDRFLKLLLPKLEAYDYRNPLDAQRLKESIYWTGNRAIDRLALLREFYGKLDDMEKEKECDKE